MDNRQYLTDEQRRAAGFSALHEAQGVPSESRDVGRIPRNVATGG